MAASEDDFDDMLYEEAEGATEFAEDMDGFEEFGDEELAAAEDWGEEDAWEEDVLEEDAYDEDDYLGVEEVEDWDEESVLEDDYEAEEEEGDLDSVMAAALAAEDTDEFLGRVLRGIRRYAPAALRAARRAAPVIGRVARTAAPILRTIPHPYARAAGTVAGLLGRLRAEGASEEEALEAVAELAARDPRALPVVAGLAARTVLKSKGARMSRAARVKAVKDAKTAAKMLVRKRGAPAIRALPRIAKSVKRTAVVKATPASARTKVMKRTAAKVARSPAMTRKLARPSPKAKEAVRRTARRVRTYTISGPARITITSA